MLNYLKKIFKKNIDEELTQFYQHAGLEDFPWISIAINNRTLANSLLTKELELQSSSNAFSLKIADTKSGHLHQLWKNQRELAHGFSNQKKEFNQLIDNLIEKRITFFQEKLSHNDSKTFTPNEVTTEDKGLEWIKVSFKILEKAIIQSLTDPNLLFQTLLFIGKNPKTSQEEIRLITFNLDIKFEFLNNGLLRIRVYDDKDKNLGSSKKASLEGDFNFRKREMFDELIKLISLLSQGIKLS